MSEESQEALANLELSRELYSEAVRSQFYADYQQVINAVRQAERVANKYVRTDPVGWKFWKRAPAVWTEEHRKLRKQYRKAVNARKQLEVSYPLLVKIFFYRYEPLG